MSRAATAVGSELAKRPLQGFNFAFVIDLLTFGQFEGLQHLLHLIQHVFQFIDDEGRFELLRSWRRSLNVFQEWTSGSYFKEFLETGPIDQCDGSLGMGGA